MRSHYAILATAALSISSQVYALVPRQSDNTAPQIIDLNGPDITYEGPWENVTSPCNLGGIARKSDNSLAQDFKATITFADNVQAFTISMQAVSTIVKYTAEAEGTVYSYDANDNPDTPAGQSGCPVLLTHNFGSGSKAVTINLRLPRSAKRDALVERQGFELPWIQINEVKALFSATATPTNDSQPTTSTQPGGSTPTPSAGTGGAKSHVVVQGLPLTFAMAIFLAILST